VDVLAIICGLAGTTTTLTLLLMMLLTLLLTVLNASATMVV
jgi:hypothetical protein